MDRSKDSHYRRLLLITHVLFWVGYLGLVSMSLSILFPFSRALLRTLLMGSFHAGLVYVNLLILMPRFFEKGAFGQYAIWTSLAVLASSLGRLLMDVGLAQWLEIQGPIAELVLSPQHMAGIVLTSFLMLLVTSPIKLIDNWYQQRQFEVEAQQQQLSAELTFLRTQVNPHFLFNSLNNLYSLAYMGSELTAPMILKLSGMMRHLLYESQDRLVPLSQELQYIADYLDLQQLKTEQPQQVEWQVIGDTEGQQIPPLLFVPLFENAVKHGNLEQTKHGWMKASVTIEASGIAFQMSNSFLPERKTHPQGGIGLENIRKRLELLYPNRHRFESEMATDQFRVRIFLYHLPNSSLS